MNKSSTKVLFFGTTDFAVPALEALIKEGYDIIAVVTELDKPVGRKQTITPSSVKVAAQKHSLKVFQPENKLEIRNLKLEIPDTVDIGVVSSYGKIIPSEILELPKHGLLNIHPSLLPKYRGPSPIQTAILNGDKETGTTIMKIDEKTDHGPILTTHKLQITADKKYQELHNELAELGAKLLVDVLPDYLRAKIKPAPQDHTKATYTKKFTLEDAEIRPEDTAERAYNKIRALNPEPGTWWRLSDGKTLKLLEAKLIYNAGTEPRGKKGLYIINKVPALVLQNGVLVLGKVQPEGKKPMDGNSFLNGYRHLFAV